MKFKFFIFLIIFLLFSALAAQAGNLKDAFGDDYLNKVAGDGAGYDTNQTDPTGMISNVIKAALSFLGVIFLILMIYGGYLWMTAGGNEQQVEKAKSLITAAIIGLIIVVSAYAISYFVMAKLDGGALK